MMMRSPNSDKAVQATKKRATTGTAGRSAKSSMSAGSDNRWSATMMVTATRFLEGMDAGVTD